MTILNTSFVAVMVLNLLLFLGQASVLEINADANNFYNCEDSLFDTLSKDGCTAETPQLDTDSFQNQLPTGAGAVSETTGNPFTDLFNTLKSWFLDVTGLKYVLAILSAPYNALAIIGLPQVFIYALGTFWYGITLFLIIMVMMQR